MVGAPGDAFPVVFEATTSKDGHAEWSFTARVADGDQLVLWDAGAGGPTFPDCAASKAFTPPTATLVGDFDGDHHDDAAWASNVLGVAGMPALRLWRASGWIDPGYSGSDVHQLSLRRSPDERPVLVLTGGCCGGYFATFLRIEGDAVAEIGGCSAPNQDFEHPTTIDLVGDATHLLGCDETASGGAVSHTVWNAGTRSYVESK
jgi:hypothetical protein